MSMSLVHLEKEPARSEAVPSIERAFPNAPRRTMVREPLN